MKKYTSFFFAFMFVFSLLGLFNLNVNSANAITSDCMPGDNFSRTTGQRCITNTIPSECRPGDLFSSVTGKPCGATTTIPVPRFCVLQNFKLGARGEDVKTFQTELNAQGAGLKVDGSYGPRTQASAQIYCKRYPFPNPSSVVISGVNGPQSLEVNQQGTWTVTASDSNGGNLSYSVVWGDEVYAYPATNSSRGLSVQQSATFTHNYSQAGIYKPTFTVTSENMIRCIQAPCPTSGGSAQTSLSVNVGASTSAGYLYISPSSLSLRVGDTNVSIKAYYQPPMPPCPSGMACTLMMPAPIEVDTRWSSSNPNVATVGYIGAACIGCKSYPVVQALSAGTAELTATYTPSGGTTVVATAKVTVGSSSITVLSPNGGETWIKGTTQTINWRDNMVKPCGPTEKCAPPAYTIYLKAINAGEDSGNYLITSATGNSYNWIVGTWLYSTSNPIHGDLYTIQVCRSGTNACDSSDSYFELVTPSYPN